MSKIGVSRWSQIYLPTPLREKERKRKVSRRFDPCENRKRRIQSPWSVLMYIAILEYIQLLCSLGFYFPVPLFLCSIFFFCPIALLRLIPYSPVALLPYSLFPYSTSSPPTLFPSLPIKSSPSKPLDLGKLFPHILISYASYTPSSPHQHLPPKNIPYH